MAQHLTLLGRNMLHFYSNLPFIEFRTVFFLQLVGEIVSLLCKRYTKNTPIDTRQLMLLLPCIKGRAPCRGPFGLG